MFLEDFPRTTIDVYIIILEANAGTRTVGINAASLALADAGVQMRDLVSSVAVGKIEGQCALDLEGEEEEATACDLPIAYMPRYKKFTLLQMDGNISKKDVKNLIQLGVKGCEILYKKQREALLKKWSAKEAKE